MVAVQLGKPPDPIDLVTSRSPFNRATTPWRPPPDAENGSPVVLGTAREADRKEDVSEENIEKIPELLFACRVRERSRHLLRPEAQPPWQF